MSGTVVYVYTAPSARSICCNVLRSVRVGNPSPKYTKIEKRTEKTEEHQKRKEYKQSSTKSKEHEHHGDSKEKKRTSDKGERCGGVCMACLVEQHQAARVDLSDEDATRLLREAA